MKHRIGLTSCKRPGQEEGAEGSPARASVQGYGGAWPPSCLGRLRELGREGFTAKLEPLQAWCAAQPGTTPKRQEPPSKWVEKPARSNLSSPKLLHVSRFANRVGGSESVFRESRGPQEAEDQTLM